MFYLGFAGQEGSCFPLVGWKQLRRQHINEWDGRVQGCTDQALSGCGPRLQFADSSPILNSERTEVSIHRPPLNISRVCLRSCEGLGGQEARIHCSRMDTQGDPQQFQRTGANYLGGMSLVLRPILPQNNRAGHAILTPILQTEKLKVQQCLSIFYKTTQVSRKLSVCEGR